VRIVLFATAREAVGRGRLDEAIGPSGIELAALLERLGTEYPRLRRVVAVSRFVVNGAYTTSRDVHLKAGDEVAVHPPYSGG